MAFAVSGLMLGGNLGQAEYAPVGVATDNTTGSNDLSTGITGNSASIIS